MAGYWHPVAGGGSRREPLSLQKHGDLLESEMSDAALLLGDPVIRGKSRTAAMVWRSGSR